MPRRDFQSTSSESRLWGFSRAMKPQPLYLLALLRITVGDVEGALSLQNGQTMSPATALRSPR
jgi:hypothetical protein